MEPLILDPSSTNRREKASVSLCKLIKCGVKPSKSRANNGRIKANARFNDEFTVCWECFQLLLWATELVHP